MSLGLLSFLLTLANFLLTVPESCELRVTCFSLIRDDHYISLAGLLCHSQVTVAIVTVIIIIIIIIPNHIIICNVGPE